MLVFLYSIGSVLHYIMDIGNCIVIKSYFINFRKLKDVKQFQLLLIKIMFKQNLC